MAAAAVRDAETENVETPAAADIPVADFDRIMAVNVRGVFLGMRHQVPAMIARGAGAAPDLQHQG